MDADGVAQNSQTAVTLNPFPCCWYTKPQSGWRVSFHNTTSQIQAHVKADRSQSRILRFRRSISHPTPHFRREQKHTTRNPTPPRQQRQRKRKVRAPSQLAKRPSVDPFSLAYRSLLFWIAERSVWTFALHVPSLICKVCVRQERAMRQGRRGRKLVTKGGHCAVEKKPELLHSTRAAERSNTKPFLAICQGRGGSIALHAPGIGGQEGLVTIRAGNHQNTDDLLQEGDS